MQTNTIRTFFACQIADRNLARIGKLINELNTRTPGVVKWVDPKNIHLTVKFIGEFKQTDVEKIKQLLYQALIDLPSFAIHIQNLGAFPSIGKPQTIWLGVDSDPLLFDLVERLEEQCATLGYPKEKRAFAAHITLGRLKPSASASDLKAIAAILQVNRIMNIGQQSIDALYFYKSELTPQGPIYQAIFEIPFNLK